MPQSQVALQVFGFGFAILGGQVLLPLLIGTILFARSVQRNPLLVSMLFPWVMYSVGVCILLYTGHIDEDVPPRAICYAQLATTLGAVVMASAALVSYSISLYCGAPRADGEEEVPMQTTYLLASIPILGVAGYEMSLLHIFQTKWDELTIERDVLVCAIKGDHEVMRSAEAIAAGATLVSVVLTVDLLCRYWSGLKNVFHGVSGYKELVLAPMKPWKQVLLRLIIFELYCLLAMGACMLLISDPSRGVREAMWSFADSVPVATALIFGTTPDVLSAWRFGRRRAEYATIP
ncbi:hypothetical protein EXIGLDRAFT_844392 [Exidia glandulosa HHB12029]|uniref:Fungal pheromone STE3G-protein-coupled receptor n=1 Tax=Exidia glandulosa HHB12029 TaxID=1314781 RepID=A0A165C2H7_EXIGL|nr:hypothetical protein EXIGLDRAFT_844392 [Exidia glandulosa HHB12029]